LVTGGFRIRANYDIVSLVCPQTGRAWVKHDQPLQHFFHDIFRTVNELFHGEANVQLLGARRYKGHELALLFWRK
jgi:hypothetical protein